MDELDIALGQRQVFNDIRSLQDRILDDQRPVLSVDTRQSTQSDKVDISHFQIVQDVFFSQGRNRARAGVQSITYTPKTGSDVVQHAAGGNGNYRINDWLGVTGDFWLNSFKSRPMPRRTTSTYDVFVTVWPSDLVRFDVDANRRTFDNIRSIQRGIVADGVGGSVDLTPSDDLRLTVRANRSSFSDTNRQRSGEVEAIWRVGSNPTIQIGARTFAYRFSKLLDNGYFNPKTYVSGEAMLRLQSALSPKLDVELTVSGGAEKANPGGTKPIFKGSLQTSYKVGKNWTLDGGASFFSSRASTSSGFSRASLSLGVHRKF